MAHVGLASLKARPRHEGAMVVHRPVSHLEQFVRDLTWIPHPKGAHAKEGGSQQGQNASSPNTPKTAKIDPTKT